MRKIFSSVLLKWLVSININNTFQSIRKIKTTHVVEKLGKKPGIIMNKHEFSKFCKMKPYLFAFTSLQVLWETLMGKGPKAQVTAATEEPEWEGVLLMGWVKMQGSVGAMRSYPENWREGQRWWERTEPWKQRQTPRISSPGVALTTHSYLGPHTSTIHRPI